MKLTAIIAGLFLVIVGILLVLALWLWRKRRLCLLVRLRRASDNAECDFYAGGGSQKGNSLSVPPDHSFDLAGLDQDAITEWAAGSELFCVVWYNQAPLSWWARLKLWWRRKDRHLKQTTMTAQPKFDLAGQLQFGEGEFLQEESGDREPDPTDET